MIIKDIRIRTLEGIDKNPGPVYDNRNVKRIAPTDIHLGYVKQKGHISVTHAPQPDGTFRITQNFLEIETSDGIIGTVGPISNPTPPFYILTQIKPVILGQNAWDIGRLWDLMYRTALNGRKGENMQAISYVDCALWDIRAKNLGQPLHRLLGGKVQDRIRAYANTAGYSQEPEDIVNSARSLVMQGYTAIKWGVSYGPAAGDEGMRKVVESVRLLRETVGPDVMLMLDAWSSWDVGYTLRIADRLKEYDLAYIEEPVMADLIPSYAKLSASCPIAISGGEHEYTRWGFKSMLDVDACELYQPDPAWSGGISECVRILDLISAYDKRASIHNSLPSLSTHISCSYPSSVVPFAEYLILVGEASQYFYKQKCAPVNGYFYPPDEPGIGIEIDEGKVAKSSCISYNL